MNYLPMNKKTLILLAFVLLGFGGWLVYSNHFNSTGAPDSAQGVADDSVPTADPIDAVLNVTESWLDNLQATTSQSLAQFVSEQTSITPALAERLVAAADAPVDPILCQNFVPSRVGAKVIYTEPSEAQVMVITRGEEKTPNQAIVTVVASQSAWVVSDITCSAGETGGPVGEYTFAETGRLVREQVPTGYDNTRWHLIFTRATTDQVSLVPLTFADDTVCTVADEIVDCDLNTLSEGDIALVQGSMLESGAAVARLER